MSGTDDELSVRIRNEFAVVDITVRRDTWGERLEITDAETGTAITLDALELEALTRLVHPELGPLILDRFPEGS